MRNNPKAITPPEGLEVHLIPVNGTQVDRALDLCFTKFGKIRTEDDTEGVWGAYYLELSMVKEFTRFQFWFIDPDHALLFKLAL